MAAPQSTPLPPAPQRNEPEAVFIPKSNAFVAALEPLRASLQAQADFVDVKVVDLDAAVNESEASAASALLSKDSATSSASAALDSKNSAAASESGVAESAASALDSKNAASSSEVNARNSELSVVGVAVSALNSETAAESSASAALVSQTEAKASELLALAAGNYAGVWSSLSGSLASGVSVAHNGEYWGSLVSIADVTASEPSVSSDWQSIGNSLGTAAVVNVGSGANDIELNSQRGFKSFDSMASAVSFVTANPSTIERLNTASKLSEAECATAGIQYPDGEGASYVIVGTGTEAADGVNFINAGTKQLKLDREKGGQRLISLIDKKTSLRMATAANIKYSPSALKKRSSVSLFLRGTPSSAVETNQRLITDPKDHFDVEIPILSEPTASTPTLISQNVSAVGNEREFQLYYDKPGNQFAVFIGGASYAMPVVAPLKGSVFRFRLSGRLNVLSASRDGVPFYESVVGFSGASSEPTATTTISARHNGTTNSYMGGSDTVFSDVVIRNKPRKIVVLGASILNGAFNNPVESVSYNHSIGSNLGDLAEYAVSGDTVSDTVAALPAILAAETEPCLFIMHIGGNDVSETRPYSTAAINRLDNLENGLIEVINTVKAAGHDFALANLTYRNYSNILPDGSNGSLPYNYNIVEPLIRELTPEWWDFTTNKPVINLYEWAFDNQALMQADGIHYTGPGYDALREHILGILADNYPKVSGYFIPLDSGSMIEPFYSYDGTEYSANLISFNPWDWFAGSASGESILNFASSEIEGVGGQLMLKNISGGILADGHYATDAELSQVFWDSAGVLTASVDALPVGSMWRSVNGGTVPVNVTKMFIRVS